MGSALPVYFWHIPKTAGTSFIQWLDSHFPSADIFQPQLLPQLRLADDRDVAGRHLFRGHLGSELPQRLGGPVTTITLLREPRARTVSHLSHIWRESPHYLHERMRATGGDLAAVVADPVLRLALSDVQSRHLALDPAGTVDLPLPMPVRCELAAQARFELAPLPTRRLLAGRAYFRLRAMSAYGFAEHLDAFAGALAARQGWPRANPLTRSNASPEGSSPWVLSRLSPAELALLDGLNVADSLVYRWTSRAIPSSGRLRRVARGRAPAPAQ